MLETLKDLAFYLGVMFRTVCFVGILIIVIISLTEKFPKLKTILLFLVLTYLVVGVIYGFGLLIFREPVQSWEDYDRYYDYNDNDMPWR